MIRHFFTPQFLGFVAVGSIAALINWSSRILFSIWVSYPVAVFIAYMVALSCAFILNKYYVFPKSDRPLSKQMRDFVITNIAFLPVVWSAAIILAGLIPQIYATDYNEEIAHAIAIAIPMFATFLIYKFIAFKESSL